MEKKGHWSGAVCLFGAALAWGLGFVSQDLGMNYMGAFTMQAARMTLAGLSLLCVMLVRGIFRKRRGIAVRRSAAEWRAAILGGLCCGAVLSIASSLQQLGIANNDTSPGKDAFITVLYIVIVPLIGLFLGRRSRPHVYVCVVGAMVGLWLLCMSGSSLSLGDAQVMGCAVVFAAHIVVLSRFADKCDGFLLSAIQFFTVAACSFVLMLILEEPSLDGIRAGFGAILYSGVVSAGLGYTLQVLGQRRTPPTLAALLMSLESVFAVLASAILLPELTPFTAREAIGMGIIFVAIICSQLEFGGPAKSAERF